MYTIFVAEISFDIPRAGVRKKREKRRNQCVDFSQVLRQKVKYVAQTGLLISKVKRSTGSFKGIEWGNNGTVWVQASVPIDLRLNP